MELDAEKKNDLPLACLHLARDGKSIQTFANEQAPAYMAEMCPPQVRGAVVSAKETVIVGGIVFGYIAGNILSLRDPLDWTGT